MIVWHVWPCRRPVKHLVENSLLQHLLKAMPWSIYFSMENRCSLRLESRMMYISLTCRGFTQLPHLELMLLGGAKCRCLLRKCMIKEELEVQFLAAMKWKKKRLVMANTRFMAWSVLNSARKCKIEATDWLVHWLNDWLIDWLIDW